MDLQMELMCLRNEFERMRKQEGRVIFPISLKRRTLSLLEHGCSVELLCQRCHLHASQVFSWKAELRATKGVVSTQPYEIREIPIVQSPLDANKSLSPIPTKKRSKFFLRFGPVKFIWD